MVPTGDTMATLFDPPFTLDLTSTLREPAYSSEQDALPAAYRAKGDKLVVPALNDLEFLEGELLVKRIDRVRHLLWICGRPQPARPLHHQLLIDREISITENPELHLVWGKKQIYLKPIPEWLLDPAFWETLLTDSGHMGTKEKIHDLIQCGRGFLFSYCSLILHRSDFKLAVEKGLLPQGITWAKWRQLSVQLQQSHRYSLVNPRYWYGELRLSRLNKIYMYGRGQILRGYTTVGGYALYNDLLYDNFALLAGLLGYVVIVLTAMQVGLGVEQLQKDGRFQDASYGFTVFAILAPLIGTALIIGLVLFFFVGHWLSTRQFQRMRFANMGVKPDWYKK